MVFSLILFSIYLSIILWLIYRNGLFGVFRDNNIQPKHYTLIFLCKAMAVPVFYLVYKKLYGGIDDLDAGKFFHDVQVIHRGALKDFGFYVRLMFGLQNDLPGSSDFENCLKDTLNWDNGTAKDYLYNDNRVLIRAHTLFAFFAFQSYFVHALFSCLLSFIGLQGIYKTFKTYFAEKEILFMLILCFVPALWFYTGALLKEGLTVFILGNLLYRTKKMVIGPSGKTVLSLLPFVFLALLLKPYLLFFSFLAFGLFFVIELRSTFIHKAAFYFSFVLVGVLALNFLSVEIKHRSLLEAALKHRRIFAGVAKGGIFLAKDDTFIRLKNDSTQLALVSSANKAYTIKKGVGYMYWINNNDQDTMYCAANKDTTTVYELKYVIQESRSNINANAVHAGITAMVGHALYYSLFYPMFVQAKGVMQLLASVENLALVLALIGLVFFLFRSKQPKFLPLVLLFVCLSVCFLVGIATPNSGAIYRYRSPVLAFVFMALLYYLPALKIKKNKKRESPYI